MSATTTPTYTPVPIVMERAARNKALREAMLASGKSPLFTALVVCKRENRGEEESQKPDTVCRDVKRNSEPLENTLFIISIAVQKLK